jgi:hypothetical protein
MNQADELYKTFVLYYRMSGRDRLVLHNYKDAFETESIQKLKPGDEVIEARSNCSDNHIAITSGMRMKTIYYQDTGYDSGRVPVDKSLSGLPPEEKPPIGKETDDPANDNEPFKKVRDPAYDSTLYRKIKHARRNAR